jgi:hypothetical protein
VDLRDPHTYVKNILCLDFTDASIGDYSVNDAIQKALQGDSNSDGRLDDSLLLLFKPDGSLDMLFEPYCTAPLDTASCTKAYARVYPTPFPSANGHLSLVPTRYHPSLQPSDLVPKITLLLQWHLSAVVNFCGNAITLQDVSVAGTLVGNPPVSILNGMLRGFLTEATADAILLPASMPVVGGLPTSALLPGGKGIAHPTVTWISSTGSAAGGSISISRPPRCRTKPPKHPMDDPNRPMDPSAFRAFLPEGRNRRGVST